jgi:hypothetical protein
MATATAMATTRIDPQAADEAEKIFAHLLHRSSFRPYLCARI